MKVRTGPVPVRPWGKNNAIAHWHPKKTNGGPTAFVWIQVSSDDKKATLPMRCHCLHTTSHPLALSEEYTTIANKSMLSTYRILMIQKIVVKKDETNRAANTIPCM
jgi:hypothetical protein